MTEFVRRDEVQAMIDAAVEAAVNSMLLKIGHTPRPFKIIGLNASKDYASKVAGHLGVLLTPHKEKVFDDGEPFARSGDGQLGNVRGHNVFVIQSLFSDEKEGVCEKFMKLCIMAGSLKDASANEVTVVVPHLFCARQDRKSDSREPITTKYVAQILEAVGVDRALFMDVHNLAAEQNAFRFPIDNLEAKNLFAEYIAKELIAAGKTDKIRILSPDSGGMSRCTRFRNALLACLIKLGVSIDDIEIVVFDKVRVKGEVVGARIIGDVKNAAVIAFDDIVATAKTMKKACHTAEDEGGEIFAICGTHGQFCGDANDILDDFDTRIIVADSIEPWRLKKRNRDKVHVVDTTHLVADAIRRIHSGTGSLSELLR